MFRHIFVNRLKCLIRDRQLMFWTFFYPLILASLFGLAFSNISSAEQFRSIPIAVVNNAEYSGNKAFQAALDSVSDANPESENPLFHITLESNEQAEADLKNNEITGYIFLEDGVHVAVKDSGIYQSIIKQFTDSYLETSSAYQTIISSNPVAAQNFKFEGETNYLTEVAPGKTDPSGTLVSFYALIAMACLFGGFWGIKQISDHQANLSPQGARESLAPVHKLKSLGYSLLAAITIQYLSVLLLVAYLAFAIKIDFGDQTPFVLLTSLLGSITGVLFGAFIGSVTKKSEGFKSAMLISISMLGSFLSGMMSMSFKYTVTHAAPALSYINPANLITDAFYSLYYYSTYERFFLNISLLGGFSVLFYLMVYFVTRRQKYASI